MSYLRLQFSDVYKEVSRYLGWGTSPTGQDLTDAKAITHAGYRKFLYPVNMQTGRAHTWSFLLKHSVLQLEEGKWKYQLPTDFDVIKIPFRWEPDKLYQGLKQVPAELILLMRSRSDSQGNPAYFSIQAGTYDASYGQYNEAWFYDTPLQSDALYYAYLLRPPQLVNDADYFIGTDFASEALLEAALAVAELRWDEQPGIHATESEKLIQQLIQADMIKRPEFIGVLGNSPALYADWCRYLETIESPYPS